MLGLVDALCKISSQVREDQALHTNIKTVVRNALLCEKVNVYVVDTMRQELVSYPHLAYQDDMEDIKTQIVKIEAELRDLKRQ